MGKQGLFLFLLLSIFPFLLMADRGEKGTLTVNLAADAQTPKLQRVAIRLLNDLGESRFYSVQERQKEQVDTLNAVFVDTLPPGNYKIQLLTPLGLKPSADLSNLQVAISAGETITVEQPLILSANSSRLSYIDEAQELEEKRLQEQRLQRQRDEMRVQEQNLEKQRQAEKREQQRLQDKKVEEKRLEWERQRYSFLSKKTTQFSF